MNQQSQPPVKTRFSINIVENEHSELLLLKRNPQANIGPDLWAFPAGHIEPGETPWECAIRELNEEIGTRFSIEHLASMGPVRDTSFGGIYEFHLYHHRWLDGEVTLNQEHTRYAWVSREDYRSYPVMDGIDEDIRYFDIWPLKFLNKDKLSNNGNG